MKPCVSCVSLFHTNFIIYFRGCEFISEQKKNQDFAVVKEILPTFESAQGRSDDLIQSNEIQFFGPPFRDTAFDELNKP